MADRTHHVKRTRHAIRRILAVGGVVVPWRRFACVYGAILEAWGHAERGGWVECGAILAHDASSTLAQGGSNYGRFAKARHGRTGRVTGLSLLLSKAVRNYFPKNLEKYFWIPLALPIDNVRMIHVRQGNQLQQETR